MDDLLAWCQPGSRRVLWLRHDHFADPARVAQGVEWIRANGLDPNAVPADGPFVVGRPLDAGLAEGPSLTVVVVVDEPAVGDEQIARSQDGFPVHVRRTVPLRVAPPPELFVDLGAEVQRAVAGDPKFREWVAERLTQASEASEEGVHNG